MNGNSKGYEEFFRTDEYNSVRELSSSRKYVRASDNLTSLDFDESTHRKNSFASSLSDKRAKRKNTDKIIAFATTGTVSIVAVVAAVLSVIAGISFVSFTATPSSVSCIVDIPEDMDGYYIGTLLDADGAEVARTETSGHGECKFAFDGLRPDTEYFFTIFDEDETQYLYESVRTTVPETTMIFVDSEEYFPHAVRLNLDIYETTEERLTVNVRYDDGTLFEESYDMPENFEITARYEGAQIATVIVTGEDGTYYLYNTYSLPSPEIYYDRFHENTDSGFDVAIFVSGADKCELAFVVSDGDEEVTKRTLSNGLNEFTFDFQYLENYDLYVVDGLGEKYYPTSATR